MWGDGFGGWLGPAVMGVTGLLVWVLLLAGAIALLRLSRHGQPNARGPETSTTPRRNRRATGPHGAGEGGAHRNNLRRRRSACPENA
jgi:hypothetical protein